MKFKVHDNDTTWQEFTIREGDKKGDVVVDTHLVEDVTPIIEQAKRERDMGPQYLGKGTQTTMKKLGTLSMTEVVSLMKSGVYYDDKALRRYIQDRDRAAFRVDK